MKVYHGSDLKIETIDLSKCKNDSKILQMEDLLVEQLMIDNRIDETQATDILYNSGTFAQLSDESTEFHKKSWQEIYEMLKKERNM